ncbi:protein DMP7-like [Vicia villosa]|uniref:protein DMP7-like n=1 Tax=Vicia villosa TaxID=3911 RepID=UPI00273AF6E9|nr:protein DMP7-like [Vicia villosa]
MEVVVDTLEQPLLENAPRKIPKTSTQKTIRRAFKCTSNLSNLLPTGTVLVFQTLSPVLSHRGQCHTETSKIMTICLLTFCSLSCFLLSFTDSLRDERGKVRYGVATLNGIWVMDGSVKLTVEEARNYKLSIIDLFHACGSILVFGAIALFDQNIVSCLAPQPSKDAKQFLEALPIWVGVLCSLFFFIFPTQRHGIGFPLSHD